MKLKIALIIAIILVICIPLIYAGFNVYYKYNAPLSETDESANNAKSIESEVDILWYQCQHGRLC